MAKKQCAIELDSSRHAHVLSNRERDGDGDGDGR